MTSGTSCPLLGVLGFLAGALCLVPGCAALNARLSYSVALRNTGTRAVYVERFTLGQTAASAVGFGRVMPGGTAGWSTIQERPKEHLVLSWREEATSAANHCEVLIRLPPQFGTERGTTINIHLNSDTKEIRVTYRVFDAEMRDYTEVDSSGHPVEIKHGAGSVRQQN